MIKEYFKTGVKHLNVRLLISAIILLSVITCKKEDIDFYDTDKVILITNNIAVNNIVKIHDPNLNMDAYEKFIKYISSSDRYLIVQQKDFEKTEAKDKVIICLRHDIDRNIESAIKMAYREHKYGVTATYFVLHTAKFYGITKSGSFKRNNNIIYFLKKLQNEYGDEIGFHNDLVTLYVVYGIDPRKFLKDELKWLRDNGISIFGSSMHGSPYCYTFHYLNTYFWKDSPSYGGNFYNYDFAPNLNVKDTKENYSLTYDSDNLKPDYNFSDVTRYEGGKRWHMGMEDFDKIPLGQKVIILTHAENWD